MFTVSRVKWIALSAVLVSLLAGLLGPAAAVLAAEPPTAYVTTGRLNVRAGPSVTYTVVTQVDQGESMALLGRNTSATWVNMRLTSGIEGWVNVRYIQANVTIASLPVTAPAPFQASATVTVSALELRAGPASSFALVATLGQGQALTLLGRNLDSSWVKARAGSLEGWVPGQVLVRLPGSENGVSTLPFQANVLISSLPVIPTGGARVSLSASAVRPAAPVYVTLDGFPANRDVAAVLTSPRYPSGFLAASGKTDGNGYAQLFFRMPDMWPNGSAIAETSLSLAVGTTDGAVTIWSGLRYSAY